MKNNLKHVGVDLSKDLINKNMIFFLILIASNLIAFQMGEIASYESSNESTTIRRKHFVQLKLNARMLTPFFVGKEIHIKTSNGTYFYAMLLESTDDSQTLYVHRDNVPKILASHSTLDILPFNPNIKQSPPHLQEDYEIHIH